MKPFFRSVRCTLLVTAALAVLVLSAAGAQDPVQNTNDARAFFEKLIGEWIGTCEQSTDGERAENKYFHALVKQVDPNTFYSQFDYYRMDAETGKPIPTGESSITTTIDETGKVTNKITGKGIVMVEKEPKPQEHELQEVLTPSDTGKMHGVGSGKLSVFGMPLGLGKNGKIRDAKSTWSLDNGVLTIDQTLVASFKVLLFNKKFSFDARYTATRGSDVAKLMTRPAQVSYKQ